MLLEMMKEYERVQQQGLDKLFTLPVLTYAQVAKELQTYLSDVIARNNGGDQLAQESLMSSKRVRRMKRTRRRKTRYTNTSWLKRYCKVVQVYYAKCCTKLIKHAR